MRLPRTSGKHLLPSDDDEAWHLQLTSCRGSSANLVWLTGRRQNMCCGTSGAPKTWVSHTGVTARREAHLTGKLDAFIRSRKGQINLDTYTSPLFSIHIGLQQGSVLSTVRFISFISDFLSNSRRRFKFADGSSVLLSGQKTTESQKNTCLDIEMCCRPWSMAIKGSKTNFLPLKNSYEDFT